MKWTNTALRYAIATGAIVPPARAEILPWKNVVVFCLVGAALWLGLAWIITALWLIA